LEGWWRVRLCRLAVSEVGDEGEDERMLTSMIDPQVMGLWAQVEQAVYQGEGDLGGIENGVRGI
jgi:hypothetical protein